MKTKILSLILAVCFIFAAVPTFTASAATTSSDILEAEVSVVSTTAPSLNAIGPGEEITFRVTIKQNTGISWLALALYFDTDAFECVEFSSKKLFGANESILLSSKKNYVLLRVNTYNQNLTNTGESFDVILKTKENYCGTAKVWANAPKGQCTKYVSTSVNQDVPFTGNEVTLPIHNSGNAVVTAPTCTSKGYTTHTCSCGEVYVGNYTKTGPHTDSDNNNICDVCKNSFYWEGDLNGDYAVDVIDLVRMKNILAGNSTSIGASADIDFNLRVNALDMLLLRKYIIGAIDSLY